MLHTYTPTNKLVALAKSALPAPAVRFLRTLRDPKETVAAAHLASDRSLGLPLAERLRLIACTQWAQWRVQCAHTQHEALTVIADMLRLPASVPGVFVEAGCFKGGSAAKWSLAAQMSGRRLVLFDSFEGIPPNDEPHEVLGSIFGGRARFKAGDYAGSLEEVKAAIAAYGSPGICDYRRGWFENTMPVFGEPVAAAYIDVDLASSTRTCLRYLYPLLSPGGFIYSQDGHLPLVIDVLRDEAFWREVGGVAPVIAGLGRDKLVRISKPSTSRTVHEPVPAGWTPS